MGFALPRIILHLLLRLNVSESIRTLNEAKKKETCFPLLQNYAVALNFKT